MMVSNLSPEGAQLDGRDMPAPGQDVFVVVGRFDTLAKVVSRTGDKCGVEFDDFAPGQALDRMKREAKWIAVAGWYP